MATNTLNRNVVFQFTALVNRKSSFVILKLLLEIFVDISERVLKQKNGTQNAPILIYNDFPKVVEPPVFFASTVVSLRFASALVNRKTIIVQLDFLFVVCFQPE